ncbi:sensor histidine kinase [Streptomyces phaeochromogenes]|uniref:sensor histidine kinase n=1 Tax=Streptomyces phaeochromogenes TaxID=1923 RepID=UPI0033E0C62E
MTAVVTTGLAAPAAVGALAATEVWATRSLGGSQALAASCLAVVALTVCRRWPWAALITTLPAASLGYVWLAPMVALYQVALRTGPVSTVIGASATAFVYFVPWPHLGPADWAPSSVALTVMFSGLISGTPVILARLVASRRELRARMAELALFRTREHTLETQQTMLRERARLSRDIHDTVAHHLSLIALQASALEVSVPPERRPSVALVRKSSQAALTDLRRLVTMLRTPAESTAGVPSPGLADLPALVVTAGSHVSAELGHLDGLECPSAVQEAVFRIVQESLTNARKHSPGAPVSVVAGQIGTNLLIEVRNEAGGSGPWIPGSGKGIQGMTERAAALGGSLLAQPAPDGGFVVQALLPLSTAAARL